MVRGYWRRVGGTLIERFPLTHSSKGPPLFADAVIFPNRGTRISAVGEVTAENEDVLVVNARAKRLNLLVMGHAVFSLPLMKRLRPRSARSIALSTESDSVLEPLLSPFPEVEVVCVRPE